MALNYSGQLISGLSSDTKPLDVPYGVMFLETDTANILWYKPAGWLMLTLAASQTVTGQFAMARLASGTPTGSKFIRDDGVLAVPAGGGGGSDPSYTPGSFTVATGTGRLIIKRMQLVTTDRATVAGTARLRIS